MFRISWGHHQAVYIINTIKLIEIAIWIPVVVQRVYIIKFVKFVENCALCYDEYHFSCVDGYVTNHIVDTQQDARYNFTCVWH
jgi:hypothetical protein